MILLHIITKIIEAKRFPKSEENRFYLFCFLVCLNLRYPALISDFNNKNNLMETAEKEAKADSALPADKFTDFMNLFKGSIAEKNRFYAYNLERAIDREYNTLINKFDISLLIRQTGEFIISDEYKYFTLYPEQEGRQECRAYIYYPITPKICIILGNKELPERDRNKNWSIQSFKDWPGIGGLNRDIALKKEQFFLAQIKKLWTMLSRLLVILKKSKNNLKNR